MDSSTFSTTAGYGGGDFGGGISNRDGGPLTASEVVERGTGEILAWVEKAGGGVRFAFEEFLYGQIRNPFTRRAYLRAVRVFANWCEGCGLDWVRVMPADVARHLDSLPVAAPTRKLHLAALHRFFDQLVLRHVILLNPALSVRGERYQVIEGKTPEISSEQCRQLLRSIDTSHVVGLRDRAVIAILIYMAARVGAVAKLRRGDFYESGGQYCLRFNEKEGKVREISVRHDLQLWLREYLQVAALAEALPLVPMFVTTEVCVATRRTANLLASLSYGLPRREQIDHDLFLAMVYVRYRRRHPQLATLWVGEHACGKAGYGIKDPDAFLRDKSGRIQRVIESAGRYSVAQVLSFHEHCSEQDLPYELW